MTDPDVPRNLTVTPGGTTGQILDSVVTVNGTNVRRQTDKRNLPLRGSATGGTVTGVKSFLHVTSVVIGQQGGSGPTFSVGTGKQIGLNHRIYNQNTTVKVYTATAAYGALTLQNAPTVVANEQNIENNTVTTGNRAERFVDIQYLLLLRQLGAGTSPRPAGILDYYFSTARPSSIYELHDYYDQYVQYLQFHL
jgi:hypothetical protein